MQRVACCAQNSGLKAKPQQSYAKNESLLWFPFSFSEKARKNHVAVSIFSRKIFSHKHVMQPVSRQPLHLYYGDTHFHDAHIIARASSISTIPCPPPICLYPASMTSGHANDTGWLPESVQSDAWRSALKPAYQSLSSTVVARVIQLVPTLDRRHVMYQRPENLLLPSIHVCAAGPTAIFHVCAAGPFSIAASFPAEVWR